VTEIRALISEDSTEAALHFPEPHPGYTLTMNAVQVDQLIAILINVREHLEPPPELPGEAPLAPS
jgi:hypothetical protein